MERWKETAYELLCASIKEMTGADDNLLKSIRNELEGAAEKLIPKNANPNADKISREESIENWTVESAAESIIEKHPELKSLT